ncbi:MFS transporter [Parashewanella spongiae]|uniref:MFS transporter n=1 Tax=Parashewanella spongiae TaxID=342950 RepID=A0A3A6U7P9_9GAMM|nr:MFS transporter [Parashewanella spongiae]MCL1078726.1 MFS transporter [Parashewanella spongiae]RJY17491.1 MFS transporter [Parashewanella spongiae]
MTFSTRIAEVFSVYAHKRVLSLLFLGFSSGLPYVLVFSTLSFWLREAGVDRTAIGYFSWIGVAYTLKWLWSPLVDRMSLPWLTRLFGRRRSWILLAQATLITAIIGMSMSDPLQDLEHLVIFTLMVAFASATQDIVIDAFRIDSAPEDMQAALVTSYLVGYRGAMIAGTAGVLTLAAWFETESQTYQLLAWQTSFQVMAGLMFLGVLATLLSKEPNIDDSEVNKSQLEMKAKLSLKYSPQLAAFFSWGYQAVVLPFVDFSKRYGWAAILILALISTYRISDIVMGIMANVFYVDMGFTKGEIASISKVYGVIMTLVGAGVGGLLLKRFGTMKILFLGALLTAITNLLFALQAVEGHNVTLLTLVISVDNFSGGIAIAAFLAYLSSLTSNQFSATQYAILSSIMQIFPKFIAGFSGVYVDNFGYVNFFIAASLIGFPVLLLIHWVKMTTELMTARSETSKLHD